MTVTTGIDPISMPSWAISTNSLGGGKTEPLQLEKCENGWLARFLHTGEVYVFNSDELLMDFISMYIDDKTKKTS